MKGPGFNPRHLQLYIFICFSIFLYFCLLKEYFRDPWNTFDFVIVIGSFLDIAMANLSEGGAGLSINFFRLFRACLLYTSDAADE